MTNVTMGNQQATEAEIGWLAGIIDGEGHIGLSLANSNIARSVKFDLQIVNTDYALIDRVIAILNKLGINPYVRERTHNKTTWSTNKIVTVGKMAHIKIVLDAVLDNLTGMKREKADVVLALIGSRIVKTHKDRYTDIELGLVKLFRERFVGKYGASTTAREARSLQGPMKIQSGLT
jgi:LAGLIDADG-like domain